MNSDYGLEFGTIFWLFEHSKLESPLQDSGFAKSIDEVVTSRSTVERTDFFEKEMFDGMIPSALKKPHNTQTHFLKRVRFKEAVCSEKRPIRTRKTNCVQDFVSISVHLERMNSWRTLRLDHKKFTEWRRPRFRRLMGLSSVIRVWHAFRSDSGRFCTSQNLKILFSF